MFPFYFRSNVRFDRYDLDILFRIVTFFIKNIGDISLEYFSGLYLLYTSFYKQQKLNDNIILCNYFSDVYLYVFSAYFKSEFFFFILQLLLMSLATVYCFRCVPFHFYLSETGMSVSLDFVGWDLPFISIIN